VLATTAFEQLARTVAVASGLKEAKIAVVQHPLGGIGPAAVVSLAHGISGQVWQMLTEPAQA
jgi:hypothetical protein